MNHKGYHLNRWHAAPAQLCSIFRLENIGIITALFTATSRSMAVAASASTKEGVVDSDSMHTVTMRFSHSAYVTLEALAQEQGKAMSEVVRDALQLNKWLWDSHKADWHLLFERHGRLRELDLSALGWPP